MSCALFRSAVKGFRFWVLAALTALLAVSTALAQVGRTVPVAGQKLAYSRVTGLLYASVPSSAPRYANTVTAIDPVNASVVASISVGGSPWELELSGDERFLWVGVTGPKAVRIDLAAWRIDLQFSTYIAGIQPDAVITDIEVFPGSPATIAVCQWQQYGGAAAVAIFDNGVVRSEASRGALGVSRIAIAAPDTIWGYNGDHTGFQTYRFQVDNKGIRVIEDPIYGLFDDFLLDPVFHNGLLYSQSGRAVDPVARRPHGRYYSPYLSRDTAFALDAERERIYFAATDFERFQLLEFDVRTYRRTQTLETIAGGAGVPRTVQSMVRVGSAGLALAGFEVDYPWVTIIPLSALTPVSRHEKPSPQPMSPGIRRIPLPNSDIVYDPRSDRIYASLSNQADEIGNSIVAVDPRAGTLGDPVWVGSDPWRMAVSDGGQYLYVSLLNNHSVQRLRLPALEPDLTIPLFSEPGDRWGVVYPARANDLLALRDQPEAVAVAKAAFPLASEPAGLGVVVYDGAVQRRQRMLHLPYDRLGRILGIQHSPDPSVLYGYGTAAFAKLASNSSGISLQSYRKGVATSFLPDMLRCQDRYCFTLDGTMIDGEKQERIGEFAFDLWDPVFDWPTAVLPDLNRGLVYFAHSNGQDGFVSAYDVWTLKMTARLKIPGFQELNGGLLLWGRDRDQMAVGANDEIALFPLSALHSVPLSEDIPEIVGKRLYIPFFRANLLTYTGLAISNPGAEEARIQWTLIGSSGDTRHHPQNPVDGGLRPNQQTARLGHEIFGIPFGNLVEHSWIEVKTDSHQLGSFFQYGTGSGLDGSVALTEPNREFYFTRIFQGSQSLRGRPARTSLAIANPHGFAINLRITFFTKGDRSVDPPKQTVFVQSLPAKGFFYGPVLGRNEDFPSAYVKIETDDEDAGAVGFALVEVEDGNSLIGLAQQTENTGDRLYSAQLAFGPGLFTSVKLVNLSSEIRNLTLRAIGDDGTDLAAVVALRLRPGEALEKDATEIFDFRGLSTASGSLEVVCDGPGVIGDVLFGDPLALRFAASLPLQTQPFRRAVFSQVANRHDFFTGLAVFNPSSVPAQVRIEVFAENGTPTGERTLSLGAGRRLSKLLAELIPSTSGQERGFVTVTSDQPLIAQQLFGDYELDRLSAVPPKVLETSGSP